jgi:ABC-type multidrug transport system ATPase subunit
MEVAKPIYQWINLSTPGRLPEAGLEDLNFNISRGERVAFVGPQFQGRSQVIRILAGTRPHFYGKFFFYDYEVPNFSVAPKWEDPLPKNLRRKVGACYEKDGLLSNVSVREGLETLFRFKYGDHNKGLIEGSKRVVRDIAEELGMEERILDSRPAQLNSAQARVAALARVFLTKPPVVALENPTDNLGPIEWERVAGALETIMQDAERVLLLSTGDWSLAFRFCTRWIYIDNGKLLFDGTPQDFMKSGFPIIQSMKHAQERRIVEHQTLWRWAI